MSKSEYHIPNTALLSRKRRVVKNAYVEIDAVAVQPGIDFCDWIKITKQHLKELENAQFEIKRSEIEHIVNTVLEAHKDRLQLLGAKFIVIPTSIFNNTLRALDCKIDEWPGVNLSRRKSPMTRYRDYFVVGKNWLSQTKTKMFGDLFWIHFFTHIRKTLRNPLLELHVIAAVFKGKVKFSNTKAMPLIAGGTLIHSMQLHQYLKELHPSLHVKDWIRQEEIRGNWRKKAEAIGKQIQSELDRLIRSVDLQRGQTHVRNALSTHDTTSNVPSMPPHPTFNALLLPPMLRLPHFDIGAPVRGPSWRVSGRRHSPMLSIPQFQIQSYPNDNARQNNCATQNVSSPLNKPDIYI
eukprot:147463_1